MSRPDFDDQPLTDEEYQIILAQQAEVDELAHAMALSLSLAEEQAAQDLKAKMLEQRVQRRQTMSAAEQIRLLNEYKKHWYAVYGVDPSLADMPKAQREAYLRRMAPKELQREKMSKILPVVQEQIRQERQKLLTDRLQKSSTLLPSEPQSRAATQIQRTVRSYLSQPCTNQKEMTEGTVHPAQIIKLKISTRGVDRLICYDVIQLYTHLVTTHEKESEWKEPRHNVLLTPDQREMIKKKWEKRSGCGPSSFTYLEVRNSRSNKNLVPLSLYDRGTHDFDSLYVLFRLSVPETRNYTYIHADGSQDLDKGAVFLSSELIKELNLKEGDFIVLEDCFQLPRLTRVLLQPLEDDWYRDIDYKDTEEIKDALTDSFENEYTLQNGQIVPIDYGTKSYRLKIVDLFGGTPEKRLPAGVSKQTTVKIEILPRRKK